LCFNCNLAMGGHGFCPHKPVVLATHSDAEPSVVAAICPGERRCTECQRHLPESAFYPSRLGRGGLQSRCRTCTREAAIASQCSVRVEVLTHYGRGTVACECCGEREKKFLALDHIDGEGPRYNQKGGNAFYGWLKRQGFPTGLRLLCHNCNCAKGRNRACPHTLGPTA
jgi:hypothetical protein